MEEEAEEEVKVKLQVRAAAEATAVREGAAKRFRIGKRQNSGTAAESHGGSAAADAKPAFPAARDNSQPAQAALTAEAAQIRQVWFQKANEAVRTRNKTKLRMFNDELTKIEELAVRRLGGMGVELVRQWRAQLPNMTRQAEQQEQVSARSAHGTPPEAQWDPSL